MSYFLLYFERHSADASWLHFNKRHESIPETFSKVNEDKSLLKIEMVSIKIDNKIIEAFIIHDSISSGRVLQAGFRNDPIVQCQRLVIGNFIEGRLAKKAFDPFFIFHLYYNTVFIPNTSLLIIFSNVAYSSKCGECAEC